MRDRTDSSPGFARVELAPGEAATVRFDVDPTQLAYYDERMKLVVEPGAVRAMAGGLEQVFDLTGPEREIAPNDRPPTISTVGFASERRLRRVARRDSSTAP